MLPFSQYFHWIEGEGEVLMVQAQTSFEVRIGGLEEEDRGLLR
jgi:hypothetical protein